MRLWARLKIHIRRDVNDDGSWFIALVLSAIAALASVNSAIIQPIVNGVPSRNRARSSEEMMPLPYCNAPISADAEPAISGTASSAQAVEVTAMMPFIGWFTLALKMVGQA